MDKMICNALSDITFPRVELVFADCEYSKHTNQSDDGKIISAQMQKLEIRLERAKTQ